MPTVRTIQATVANAIPVPNTALGKSTSTLNKIISALEERESQLLAALQTEVDEYDDDESIDLYRVARERGFLGT